MDPFLFFYDYVRCGLWASSGPFPLSAHYGLYKRGRDPPPPTNPSRHLKKKKEHPSSQVAAQGRARRETNRRHRRRRRTTTCHRRARRLPLPCSLVILVQPSSRRHRRCRLRPPPPPDCRTTTSISPILLFSPVPPSPLRLHPHSSSEHIPPPSLFPPSRFFPIFCVHHALPTFRFFPSSAFTTPSPLSDFSHHLHSPRPPDIRPDPSFPRTVNHPVSLHC